MTFSSLISCALTTLGNTRFRALCLGATIILFSGCGEKPIEYISTLGQSCTVDFDCNTPLDYLIQSNCPFSSACIEGTCQVICPLYTHNPDPAISQSSPMSCTTSSDCTCAERGDRTQSCVCLHGSCVSVETNL